MTYDGDTLLDEADALQLKLMSPTTQVLPVGLHIFYVDTSKGRIVDLRKREAMDKLLLGLNLLPPGQQITKELHYAFIRLMEDQGQYLELCLLQRGLVEEYRDLLAVMNSKRHTAAFIQELTAEHGPDILFADRDTFPGIEDWMLDLPVELDSTFQVFDPYEPRVP
jgi:hypothetical protein